MNKVILMGRLTRDPEVRYSNDMAIARFSIAVDRRFKREGEQEADFFNCVAFRKTGEFVEKYLHKGTKIVLDGEIHNNNYTDKNGNKQYAMEITVNTIEFAESKNAQGGGNAGGTPANTSNNAAPSADAGDGFMSIPDGADDELPFTS